MCTPEAPLNKHNRTDMENSTDGEEVERQDGEVVELQPEEVLQVLQAILQTATEQSTLARSKDTTQSIA